MRVGEEAVDMMTFKERVGNSEMRYLEGPRRFYVGMDLGCELGSEVWFKKILLIKEMWREIEVFQSLVGAMFSGCQARQ